MGKQWKPWDFIFGGSKITADGDCSHEIKRCLLPRRKAMTNLDSIKNQRHYFANKGPSSQSYGFSNSHVWMWQLDYKENWVPKNWCCWIGSVGENSWKSLGLTAKRSNQWILKEISPEYSLEGLKLKLKLQYLGSPDAKNWLIRKDHDAGRRWRQEQKGTTEDEMVGWLHWLDGHEFEQVLRVGDGQRSLVCCSPWGLRVGHNWVLNW